MAGSAQIGALRVVLGIDTAAFTRGLANARKSIANVGQRMQTVGTALSAGVSAPLAGIGALVVRTAGNFEASMNRVQAATGATTSEFASLRNLAKDLGRTTQFTASQSADAIEMLAKNGLGVSDIIGGALSASLKLAASSGGDLSSSADLATDVMLNFGKKASDLKGVVDGVTGVLLQSKFGFDDYRLALGQAGGVAGGLGVTLDDFNATIAATSARFASGSDAGTSFKTFLQRLVPASAPAAQAMEKLGLKFFDAQGKMKGMAGIAQELKVGFAGLSDEAKNDALSTIFGTDAMRTAIGLMEQGSQGIENLRAKIGEASADEQAAARMKGFSGELLKMKSAFEGLGLAIADSGLLQFVTDIVGKLASLASSLSETNPALLKWGTVIAAAGVALGPVVLSLGLMATAAAAISAPVWAAVAAVAAVAAGITALYQGIQLALPFIKQFAADPWGMLQQGIDAAKGALSSLVEAVKALGPAMTAAFETVKAEAAKLAADLLAAFKALPGQMLQVGKDIMAGLGNGIKEGAVAVVEAGKSVGSAVIGGIKGIFDSHSPSRVMHAIGGDVMQGLANGMASMQGTVGVSAATAVSSVTSATDSLSQMGQVGQSIGQTISSAFKGVIDGSKSVKDALSDILSSLADMALNSAFSKLFGGGSGGGSGIFGSIFSGIGSLFGFANGGSFGVGGAGGIDSQLVAFRASPNETVSVTKPGQDMGGGAMAAHISVGVDPKNGNITAFVDRRASTISQQGDQATTSRIAKDYPTVESDRQRRRG